MSRAYFTEDQKINQPLTRDNGVWSMEEMLEVSNLYDEKGYWVNVNLRRDHNGRLHQALIVERDLIGLHLEALFQQRIMVEVEAIGKGKANIILVCDDSLSSIRNVIKRLPKLEVRV